MILAYRILTTIIYPFLFIIIIIRVFLKKEDPNRYKEKIFSSSYNTVKRQNRKLIWFHAASIGELNSIIPIIQKLNYNKNIFEFLVTTNTLSSGKIAERKFSKSENIYHRYFPFDINFLVKKFLRQWRPDFIFLVDSEIWPNLILNTKKIGIPLCLINARITSKSFKRWLKFPRTAKKIFNSFDLCLSSNKETEKFLRDLELKNVHYHGNIKFFNNIEEYNINNINKDVLTNRKFWIAASTHPGEEELCFKTHLLLKDIFKNILTIIAPRHIGRSLSIHNLSNKYKLNTQILKDGEKIEPNKDIVILNSFGVLQNYFKYAKSVFIGKSTIKKLKDEGGQNPLEAAKLKCKIYHGPYVYNFDDIYATLKKNNISKKIENHEDLASYLKEDLKYFERKDEKILEILNDVGEQTLDKTLKSIETFINNETN